MATVVLNPSSVVTAVGWASGGSTASELDYNQTSNAWEGNNGATAKMTVELDDFDDTGVASIDSVRPSFVSYLANARSGTITATTRLNKGTLNLYSEDITVTVNGGAFATYHGTARTTFDGSAAWGDDDIDELRLEIFFATPPGNTVLQQAYVTISYTETVSGYTHDVSGVAAASIGEINTVATANIGKVIGVD